MTTDDTPFPGTGYLQIGIPGVPYSAIRVPIINDLEQDNLWVEHAMLIATLTAKVYKEAFPQKDVPQGTVYERDDPGGAWAPPPPQQARPQAHQRPPQGQQGGQQQTRADRFPVLDGWECDRCHGPVGRRAATGNMRGDAAVCLGSCKDGQYVHHVDWINQ